MPRYVAFLRGVSPLNAKMPELKRCFESAGFTDVRTLLSSGNVVFSARSAAPATLQRRAESAMSATLARTFSTFIRSVAELNSLIESDPFKEHGLPADTKRVVTFLRRPTTPKNGLPMALDDVTILKAPQLEVFSAYAPGPNGPVLMRLIEKTFGSDVTTRTWDTVRKCAQA